MLIKTILKKASLESLKSLAAVFQIDLSELSGEKEMNTETKLSAEEQQVIEHVRDIKAFYSHATSYALIVGALFILNQVFSYPLITYGLSGSLWVGGVVLSLMVSVFLRSLTFLGRTGSGNR